ncbi:MAG: 50S ribosomal protein L28 [Melioribacteraceae bacterium]|jgi:large subunit ribosomal protein L28|nr:50S ribosomal protein L28 [Melioribacteraceae bacterium]
MARRCQVSGVGPVAGSSISHAHNKTKRRFLPNLQKKRLWVKELNKFVTVKISASALRTVAKNGTSEIAKLVTEKKIKAR